MSILGRFSRSGGKVIPANAAFRLTQQGQEKLQDFGSDPRSRILVALETGGTSDVDEISQRSGLSKGQVERLIPSLVRKGYVQYTGTSLSGEDE